MFSLEDIKKEKDLRKVKFADFFYEFYDEEDGKERVLALITTLYPEFENEYRQGRIEAASYDQFRKKLEDERFNRELYAKFSAYEDEMNVHDHLTFQLTFWNQRINDSIMRAAGEDIEKFFNEGQFEDVCELLYGEYLSIEFTEEKKSGYLIDSFVKDDERYSQFAKSLKKKISELASRGFSKSKVIKGLYLIPYLDSDQELIIYYGNNFHTTFDSLDAYTGLLYASEYFDTENKLLTSITCVFTEDEYKTANAETKKRVDDKRAAEEKREKEAELARQYETAKGYLNGESYDAAYRAFGDLGDYRDSQELAEKSKVASENQKKRKALAAKALKVVPPMIADGFALDHNKYEVKWRVLDEDVDSGRVLLISEDCIGYENWGRGTWKDSSLRKWLNGEFYDSLPEDIRIRIVETDVQDLDAGQDVYVKDKVFILSMQEVYRYFKDARDRRSMHPGKKMGACWFTRNQRDSNRFTTKSGRYPDQPDWAKDLMTIHMDGTEYSCGRFDPDAVRPTFWVEVEIGDEELATKRKSEQDITAYTHANKLMEEGDYKRAKDEFTKLGQFRDSQEKVKRCEKGIHYQKGQDLMKLAQTEKEYLAAVEEFEKAGNFNPSHGYSSQSATSKIESCKRLARKSRLTDGLARLVSEKPKEPSGMTQSEKRVQDLESRKKKAETELANLGLFHGKEKQRLREECEQLSAQIAGSKKKAQQEQAARQQKYDQDKAEYLKKAQTYLKEVREDDEILFGGKKKGQNGKPSLIAWTVVEKRPKKMLLRTWSGKKPYHEKKEQKYRWRNSSLREWLKENIYKKEFTEAERKVIGAEAHDGVTDYIFIPSENEIAQYGINLPSGSIWVRSEVDERGRARTVYKSSSGGVRPQDIECTKEQSVLTLMWINFE